MVQKELKIENLTGLHLRPAGLLCNTASSFSSKITFKHGNSLVNAKSVLSVLGAQVKYGDEIELYCEGEDEAEALETIAGLIESGLGE